MVPNVVIDLGGCVGQGSEKRQDAGSPAGAETWCYTFGWDRMRQAEQAAGHGATGARVAPLENGGAGGN
jgi:hypothetical protein